VPDQDSDDAPHLDGVFMAHLLDEEFLDSQSYHGSDDVISPRPVLEGEDLQADIKKHLNVDFASEEGSQRSISEHNQSRRDSLQSLDNLANQLDEFDDKPKGGKSIYDYPAMEELEHSMEDPFEQQRESSPSKYSTDQHFYQDADADASKSEDYQDPL
jgi:hypothetical protein